MRSPLKNFMRSAFITLMRSNYSLINWRSGQENTRTVTSELLDKDSTEPKTHVTLNYNWFIREVPQRILVLNLDNFESIITKIHQAVLKAGRSLNRIGILEIDANGLKRIKKIS